MMGNNFPTSLDEMQAPSVRIQLLRRSVIKIMYADETEAGHVGVHQVQVRLLSMSSLGKTQG